MSALHKSDLSPIPNPNPGSGPTPDPYPIPGGGQPFNTTGYPTPPPKTTDTTPAMSVVSKVKALSEATLLSGFKPLQLFPSDALLEFSIGDLLYLGKFKNIGELVFEIFFNEPANAELRTFSIEIASPERKELKTICIEPCEIKDRSSHQSFHIAPTCPKPTYQFSLTESEAQEASEYFVRGNRLIIDAQASEEVTNGLIQLAVRECR